MELTEQRDPPSSVGRIGNWTTTRQCQRLTVRGWTNGRRNSIVSTEEPSRFVSKEEAITSSDIEVNAMNLPRNRNRIFNLGYFSESTMRGRETIHLINVTRGGDSTESVLLDGTPHARL
jgi:hypothetical protein